MSLSDIQRALQGQISAGELGFDAIGAQLPSLGLVTEALPPISAFPVASAQLVLAGQGASQTLTISGTVDWQLLTPTTASVVVSVDPSDATKYVVAVRFTAPRSAKLAIPGVPWFALGDFEIAGQSQPAESLRTELLPQALVSVGTTLLIEGDSSKTSIPITIGNDPTGALRLDLNTSAVTLPSINDVLAAFGSSGSKISLPDSINQLLSFSIEDLFVCFDPSTSSVTQIGVQIGKQPTDGHGWPILPGFFTLNSYALALNILDPLGTALVGGMVSASGKLGSVDIGVSALHPASGGWSFNGYIGKEHGVPLGELVDGLASQFNVPIPAALKSFTLNNFELSFDSLTYDTHGHFSLDFDVNGTAVDLTASAALTYQNSTYKPSVDGKLTVGTSVFEVTFGSSTFTASWGDKANPLEFKDIAERFGFTDIPEIPPGLDLGLVGASISYNFSNGALVLTAQSKTYGDAAFVALDGKYFFGVAMKHPIVLTDLPLLSSAASGDAKVEIDDIQVVVASAQIDAKTVAAMKDLLSKSGVQVPTGLSGQQSVAATLSMDFTAGGYQQSIVISTADDGRQVGDVRRLPVAAVGNGSGNGKANGTVASSKAPDGTMWYDLQKSFGPISFQKVGIRYRTIPRRVAAPTGSCSCS